MELLFTIIIFLNIPMAIASFIFAFILLGRSKSNAIYFNFGMATLFLALWISETFFAFFPIFPFTTKIWILTSFSCGLGIMHFFLMFTYNYPFSKAVSRYKIIILYIASILVASSPFVPKLYIQEISLDFPFIYERDNFIGLTIFSTYFVLLAALSFINLIKSYRESDGIFRINLKKIIVGTGIAVIANLIFSIFLYYFSTFEATPIGVLFTFGVILYIYSILFSK